MWGQRNAHDKAHPPDYIEIALRRHVLGDPATKVAADLKRHPLTVAKWPRTYAPALQRIRDEMLASAKAAVAPLLTPTMAALTDALDPSKAQVSTRLDAAKVTAGYLWGRPGSSDQGERQSPVTVIVYNDAGSGRITSGGPVLRGNQVMIEHAASDHESEGVMVHHADPPDGSANHH